MSWIWCRRQKFMCKSNFVIFQRCTGRMMYMNLEASPCLSRKCSGLIIYALRIKTDRAPLIMRTWNAGVWAQETLGTSFEKYGFAVVYGGSLSPCPTSYFTHHLSSFFWDIYSVSLRLVYFSHVFNGSCNCSPTNLYNWAREAVCHCFGLLAFLTLTHNKLTNVWILSAIAQVFIWLCMLHCELGYSVLIKADHSRSSSSNILTGVEFASTGTIRNWIE